MNYPLKEVIINELESLSSDQQKKLLDYLLKLKLLNQKNRSNNNLKVFSGSISKDDLAIMEKAIEDGCEKVDLNEW